MLFHLSIEADRPQHVAEVIAEIWGGVALPFLPVAEGSWMAFAPGGEGRTIEIYPRGTVLVASEDAVAKAVEPRRHNATHFAMATGLSIDRIYEIAAREGWTAKYCKRGGKFGVVELWVEECQLIEVLTPEMQAEHLAFVQPENCAAMFGAGRREAA